MGMLHEGDGYEMVAVTLVTFVVERSVVPISIGGGIQVDDWTPLQCTIPIDQAQKYPARHHCLGGDDG